MSLFRLQVALLGMFLVTASPADFDPVARGVALRHAGSLHQAIDYFRGLLAGGDASQRDAVSGELGATLLQARHFAEAESLLRAAYGKTLDLERARYAIELGNLAAAQQQRQAALPYYGEARRLAGDHSLLGLMARINEAHLANHEDRSVALAEISRDLDGIGNPLERARMRLSVGTLAAESGSLKMAYENFQAAEQAGDARIEIEALDGLAQLYEGQGRKREALQLSRAGVARARKTRAMVSDLLIRLEWRQGRLFAAAGADADARAAYQRAIEGIEDLRQDIPIEYENGRSSFRDTLEPIYLGYIDLLLKQADTGADRAVRLRRARDIAELIKQSELTDYLGERCSVDSARHRVQAGVAPGMAILYPIVLKDRIAVIFESSSGITSHTTHLDALSLRDLVLSYTGRLRNGLDGYLGEAGQIYDILVRPFEKQLEGVHTLLVVPDGVLRLLPWATLYDGRHFLVENAAIVVDSGLSMTVSGRSRDIPALVAGLAQPGPVIEKLTLTTPVAHALPPGIAAKLARNRSLRSLYVVEVAGDQAHATTLRERLALPGVKAEVDALAKLMPGTGLLDASFTTRRLHDEFDKGDYRTVHIATHGYFGRTAEQSYLLAYDDLVTMDGLQKLLRLKHGRPIGLLTLSACETAEGDDRSPLGLAGAAIKARAKSVLGTLWPVSDLAAQKFMTDFYGSLMRDGVSKAEALRRAQLALINHPDFQHPFYWAPFILIGNWQ